MAQEPGDITAAVQGGERDLEQALQGLWDRVRRAGEMIQRLREERQALQSQVVQLRDEVQQLQRELAQKDQTLKQATTDHGQRGGAVFSNGEKEQLASRVRDLLTRIEAYL